MSSRPALDTFGSRVRGSVVFTAAVAALAAAVAVVAIVILLAFAGPRKTADTGFAATVELPVPPAAETPDAPPPLPPVAAVDGGLVVPPYTVAAFAGMPALPAEEPLPTPRIDADRTGLRNAAADGRPSHVYARPFDRRDDRARLVVIILDIGLSRAASEAAIRRLPGAVVLAIDAYAAKPAEWARAAREAGHEIVATVPLKTDTPPGDDAGPRAVPVSSGDAESQRRLEATLGGLDGYVGVLMRGGAPGNDEAFAGLRPALDVLQARGLLLVDGIAGGSALLFQMAERLGLPRARLDVMIGDVDAATVDRQLATMEAAARERFVAVAGVRPTPTTLDRLRSWISRLDQTRYVLAPVSAVAAGAQP